MRKVTIFLILAIIFSAFLIGCSDRGNTTKATTIPETPTEATKGCDPDLWKRVYNPSRLEVLDPCKQVTGTIEELDQNEDGDTHMLLKLDPGHEDLLRKKNNTKKDGNLVIEVVCSAPVTQKKVGETCKGYDNHVKIPKVGDHVIVTGSYVNDTHNGWTEIHPVSRIESN